MEEDDDDDDNASTTVVIPEVRKKGKTRDEDVDTVVNNETIFSKKVQL